MRRYASRTGLPSRSVTANIMKIFVLFDRHGRHLDPLGDPGECPLETSPDRLIEDVRRGQERLREIPVADIIGLCDAAGRAWIQPHNDVARVLGNLAIGFLPLWLRRTNLEALVA